MRAGSRWDNLCSRRTDAAPCPCVLCARVPPERRRSQHPSRAPLRKAGLPRSPGRPLPARETPKSLVGPSFKAWFINTQNNTKQSSFPLTKQPAQPASFPFAPLSPQKHVPVLLLHPPQQKGLEAGKAAQFNPSLPRPPPGNFIKIPEPLTVQLSYIAE